MAARLGVKLAMCVAGSAVWGACGPPTTPAGSSDWALHLAPTTHPNQLPFAGGPTAKLLLRRSTGDEVIDLGEVREGGELQATGLPSADEVADVLSIGLAIEEPGGVGGAITPGLLTAYGEVPFDIEADDAPLLVSALDRIGDLGTLPAAKQRFLRVAGMVPPGKVYLFTGAPELGRGDGPDDDQESDLPTPVTADIFELTSLDGGAPWSFEKIGDLKGTSNPPARVSAAASSVLVGEAPMILISGGRDDFWTIGPSYDDWFLWDPATLEISKKGKLSDDRSEHFHVPLANGSVLVAGGWSGAGRNTADLINPTAGSISEVDLELPGESGSNGASLGADGALVCGGMDLLGLNAEAISECVIVNFQGSSSPAASLPIPLAKFAMSPAGEGYVLVAGGITWTGQESSGGTYDAVEYAFLYDAAADRWTELNPLNDARSSAVGIPLANGRVLIAGGALTDGVLQLPTGEVECPEVYDPGTGTFSRLDDQCGSWGAGAAPPVAQWPGLGTVLLKGYTVDEDPQDAVGFLGASPVTDE